MVGNATDPVIHTTGRRYEQGGRIEILSDIEKEFTNRGGNMTDKEPKAKVAKPARKRASITIPRLVRVIEDYQDQLEINDDQTIGAFQTALKELWFYQQGE